MKFKVTAVDLGPDSFSAAVEGAQRRVRLSSEEIEAILKRRMPTDRNLGTRVHRDKKKFHKTKRQKEKQDLRRHESSEDSHMVTAQVGGTIKVKIRGLGKVYEEEDMKEGSGYSIPIEEPAVQKVIDSGMKSKGFGRRQSGRGQYDSDYWEKGGKNYRIHDDGIVDLDILILEEFLPGGRW